jgi:ferrochelatase
MPFLRTAVRAGRVDSSPAAGAAERSAIPRDKTGLLLINLGTPDSPRIEDVRSYLREFLMDPRVIDIPTWKRRLIVHAFILPFRPRRSAEAYRQIWTEQGSPLMIHGKELAEKVRARVAPGVHVELAMRYGNPSIAAALERFRNSGVRRIVVFPMYPQYSSATTGSTLDKVFEEAGRRWNVPNLQVVPPFYDNPAFLDAAAASARPTIERIRPEKVFMSFHGLPERQIRKGDESGRHCLANPDCCRQIGEANRDCYRAQCFATAGLIAERLELSADRYIVCFQSRLGRDPWISPYTEDTLVEQARGGCRRAVILSPAFVADCLETLEELGIRGAEIWRENGGQLLELAPAPNSTDVWADAVVAVSRESSRWLDPGQP